MCRFVYGLAWWALHTVCQINGASGEVDMSACPMECRSPKCRQGVAFNGGRPLHGVNKSCVAFCSIEYNGLRYCGRGPDYEMEGSIECSECPLRHPTPRMGRVHRGAPFVPTGFRGSVPLRACADTSVLGRLGGTFSAIRRRGIGRPLLQSTLGKCLAGTLSSLAVSLFRRYNAMAPVADRRSRSRHRSRSGGRVSRKAQETDQQRSVPTPPRAGLRERRRERSRSYERREDHPRVTLTARRDDRERDRDRSIDSRRAGNTERYADLETHEATGAGRGKGKGKGGRGYPSGGSLRPPARPGKDDDKRLQDLEDDPRYFEGAELGKAQKAALGIKGLHGRNTASFEPDSTLVRPAMRVFYGAPKKRFGDSIKPDDVVIVPDFFCEEGNFDIFDRIVQELTSVATVPEVAPESFKLDEMPLCEKAISKLCKYFSITADNRAVRIAWYRSGADENPVVVDAGPGKFGNVPKSSRGQNCIATLAFGGTRELAFRRTQTQESVFFPQMNGALTFFGRDVCLRWQQGMNMCPEASERSNPRGHISITVMGCTENAVEETHLRPAPSDEKRGQDAYDGHCNKPCTDIVRPQMRIITTPPRPSYGLSLKHDDVVVVPEFFCKEDDWDIYYQLLKEMRESQAAGERKAEWLSWHEGAHLLSQNPTGSKTYQRVLDKMCEYFAVAPKNRGTRFNWYRDGSDWKPFHHDSAAFNEQRAKDQNTTIGISFGAARELAFRHAKTGELIYFPQKNGMLFYFGRDANIVWQHGINALPDSQQDGKGRISIILWGLCTTVTDELGSPPMLTDESRGGSKGKGKGKGKGGFSMHAGGSQQPCRDFQKGRCSYGERCRFSHAV